MIEQELIFLSKECLRLEADNEGLQAKLAAAEEDRDVHKIELDTLTSLNSMDLSKVRAGALEFLVRGFVDVRDEDHWDDLVARAVELLGQKRGPTPESQQGQAHATAQPGMPTSYPTEPGEGVNP